MGQIIVMRGNMVERVHPLSRANVTVGRLDQNELIIDHPSVSRAHTRFGWDGAGWYVEDLGSTNGTLLNGRPVERSQLRWGDRVGIGEYTLHFLPDPDTAAEGTVRDSDTVEQLISLSAQLLDLVEPYELLGRLLDRLMQIFQAERGFVLLAGRTCSENELTPAICRSIDTEAEESAISKTIADDVFKEQRPLLITDALAEMRYQGVESIERGQIRSIVCVPLPGPEEPLGVVYLDSRATAKTFTAEDMKILKVFSDFAARAVRRAESQNKMFRHFQLLRRLEDEGTRREHDYEHIIGDSTAMKEVLRRVDDIASGDIATLLLGESGTGKELIARAIHFRSARRDKPFVAVNCVALSPGVIASELFGHEKGAFTGATSRRLGRCELADGGTLFLDEIGELAPEIQVKLLRFLQEQTFERVGGSDTIKVDVRVIAATNADVEAKVAEGSFREDLYYRINAFTLTIPPLRERREDIPLLANHYAAYFAAKMGRPFHEITDEEVLSVLIDYHWPGNVRELRNVMERAMVLERDGRLTCASLPFAKGGVIDTTRQAGIDISALPRNFRRAKEIFEKEFFSQAIKRNDGHIARTAREIGLPRKTIYRKVEIYGIARREDS